MIKSARKPLFDLVRKLLGRGFTKAEVRRIDQVLDELAGKPMISVPKVARKSTSARSIGADGIALIKRFEGCERIRKDGLVEAYPDPGTGGDPWTIGWGATRDGLHGEVGPGTVWTRQQCDERLENDLKRYSADVGRAIGAAPTTQVQFDALVSFHYNTGAISRATLTRRHIAGDYKGAFKEFARWNKAGGRVLRGLVRRRAAEAELYQQSEPPPQ